MCWHQSSDTFRYKSKEFKEAKFTKRSVLSEIAQIFDPLGFIAPVVIRGKIIIQDSWRLKLNWDEPLPVEYVRQWRSFREQLTQLDQVSVPRWLKLSSATSINSSNGSSGIPQNRNSQRNYINSNGMCKNESISAKTYDHSSLRTHRCRIADSTSSVNTANART